MPETSPILAEFPVKSEELCELLIKILSTIESDEL
jgi:hypothetical protein